jgi:hypothetical protein
MGARGKQEVPEESQEVEQGTRIVEVPINLELINNKLNYLISKIDSMSKE